MNRRGKSDSGVVPMKSPNKARALAAEVTEGRPLAKRNSGKQNELRTQRRESSQSALARVREAAMRDKKKRFTALFHHIYDIDRLRSAYAALSKHSAAGIDGETWKTYGQDLDGNLEMLSRRLKQNAYRAKPVRRAHVPKADGRARPIGVPTLEDKIVQRATVEVLNAIYEMDFLGFSYGFRPRRSQHMALDALTVGITRKRVNWVLDADIRSFFDTLKHEWLVKFLEHRIGDRRVVRLIQKWLRAGVLEQGIRSVKDEGAVQGGSISPLLANLYLHYVLDAWAHRWRVVTARANVMLVRYADDFVVGFESRRDAMRFRQELAERLGKFGLQLHAEKTRLIEFGLKVTTRWWAGAKTKPQTFNFLGFTHVCARNRKGLFIIRRQTQRERMTRKLREVKVELRKRMHDKVAEQGKYLRALLEGHNRYYGLPYNFRKLVVFRSAVVHLWWKSLQRRSQTARRPLKEIWSLARRLLPRPRIHHPYPSERFAA